MLEVGTADKEKPPDTANGGGLTQERTLSRPLHTDLASTQPRGGEALLRASRRLYYLKTYGATGYLSNLGAIRTDGGRSPSDFLTPFVEKIPMTSIVTRSTDLPNLPIPGARATAAQLCAKYQVSRATWWRWSKTPGFPEPIRFGRSVRWEPESVDAFLTNQER